MTAFGLRRISLWIPDWPLVHPLGNLSEGSVAVVVSSGIVRAATVGARKRGVRRGMREQLARQYCPELMVLSHDEQGEAVGFERVVEIFDEMVVDAVILRPGLAWAPARGAVRWFGNEETLMEEVAEVIVEKTGLEAQVGIGSGFLAPLLAVRRGINIPANRTAEQLSSLTLSEVNELVSQCGGGKALEECIKGISKLGIRTVGQLLALNKHAFVSRFGIGGETLWQWCSGADGIVRVQTRHQRQVEIAYPLDPPLLDCGGAIVPARQAAARFADLLLQNALYVTRIRISCETSVHTVHEKSWAMVGGYDTQEIARRIIWQLQAVSSRSTGYGEGNAAVVLIRITSCDASTIPTKEALWGSDSHQEKILHTVEQIEELLGEESVFRPQLKGGYDPKTRCDLVPWHEFKKDAVPTVWEGGIPYAPIRFLSDSQPIRLLGMRSDGTQGVLWVDQRGFLTGVPQQVHWQKQGECVKKQSVTSVGGLWPIRGKWWENPTRWEKARCFLWVETEDAEELLLAWRESQWTLEGVNLSMRMLHPSITLRSV